MLLLFIFLLKIHPLKTLKQNLGLGLCIFLNDISMDITKSYLK